jgi:hypothetical protein
VLLQDNATSNGCFLKVLTFIIENPRTLPFTSLVRTVLVFTSTYRIYSSDS